MAGVLRCLTNSPMANLARITNLRRIFLLRFIAWPFLNAPRDCVSFDDGPRKLRANSRGTNSAPLSVCLLRGLVRLFPKIHSAGSGRSDSDGSHAQISCDGRLRNRLLRGIHTDAADLNQDGFG